MFKVIIVLTNIYSFLSNYLNAFVSGVLSRYSAPSHCIISSRCLSAFCSLPSHTITESLRADILTAHVFDSACKHITVWRRGADTEILDKTRAPSLESTPFSKKPQSHRLLLLFFLVLSFFYLLNTLSSFAFPLLEIAVSCVPVLLSNPIIEKRCLLCLAGDDCLTALQGTKVLCDEEHGYQEKLSWHCAVS